MNFDYNLEGELIENNLKLKHSYREIVNFLKDKHGSQKGLSTRSLRRYVKINN